MSKLMILPALIASRPRLFWGILIAAVFAFLVINCGFTFLPHNALPAATPEPTLAPPTPTPLPSARQNTDTDYVPPTPTPLPSEWYSTPDQTTGIILGASVLLLVVLIGTLSAMRTSRQKPNPPVPPQKT
jgi:hypothetical protein